MDTSYWVVEIGIDLTQGSGGNWFFVPAAEAEKIRAQIEPGLKEFFDFLDCSGSRCFYRCSEFVGMYESTPDQRERGRALSKALDAEVETIPGMDT